ncbi:MAG: GAF domain-containing protein [Gemmatimonadota bacterium]
MAEYTLVADRSGELRLSAEDKEARYREVGAQVEAVLEGEADLLAGMATVVCLLHNAFPYYFWTGFYRRVSADELLVGPYQGTMGCLRIRFGRGVCGAAARERRTVVVPDVHAFPGHIACDSASASEIVVPVFDAAGELIAVLDVDSTIPDAFDDVDREHLERIVALLSPRESRPVVATG